jgi:hypothetical protein
LAGSIRNLTDHNDTSQRSFDYTRASGNVLPFPAESILPYTPGENDPLCRDPGYLPHWQTDVLPSTCD